MAINRDEPSRLTYPLGNAATVATLPQTSDTVASTSGLFPYLTQVPVAQGGAYPRREDINALIKALADHGATPLDSAGEPFDANFHEALAQLPSEDVEEGRNGTVCRRCPRR